MALLAACRIRQAALFLPALELIFILDTRQRCFYNDRPETTLSVRYRAMTYDEALSGVEQVISRSKFAKADILLAATGRPVPSFKDSAVRGFWERNLIGRSSSAGMPGLRRPVPASMDCPAGIDG